MITNLTQENVNIISHMVKNAQSRRPLLEGLILYRKHGESTALWELPKELKEGDIVEIYAIRDGDVNSNAVSIIQTLLKEAVFFNDESKMMKAIEELKKIRIPYTREPERSVLLYNNEFVDKNSVPEDTWRNLVEGRNFTGEIQRIENKYHQEGFFNKINIRSESLEAAEMLFFLMDYKTILGDFESVEKSIAEHTKNIEPLQKHLKAVTVSALTTNPMTEVMQSITDYNHPLLSSLQNSYTRRSNLKFSNSIRKNLLDEARLNPMFEKIDRLMQSETTFFQGKKFKGRHVKDLTVQELDGVLMWLQSYLEKYSKNKMFDNVSFH